MTSCDHLEDFINGYIYGQSKYSAYPGDMMPCKLTPFKPSSWVDPEIFMSSTPCTIMWRLYKAFGSAWINENMMRNTPNYMEIVKVIRDTIKPKAIINGMEIE